MSIRVFNIEFKSLRSLQMMLGYASPLSSGAIARQYGGVEKLVLTRLKTDDKKEAIKKLKELQVSGAAAGAKAQKKELKIIYKWKHPHNVGKTSAHQREVNDLRKHPHNVGKTLISFQHVNRLQKHPHNVGKTAIKR